MKHAARAITTLIESNNLIPTAAQDVSRRLGKPGRIVPVDVDALYLRKRARAPSADANEDRPCARRDERGECDRHRLGCCPPFEVPVLDAGDRHARTTTAMAVRSWVRW